MLKNTLTLALALALTPSSARAADDRPCRGEDPAKLARHAEAYLLIVAADSRLGPVDRKDVARLFAGKTVGGELAAYGPIDSADPAVRNAFARSVQRVYRTCSDGTVVLLGSKSAGAVDEAWWKSAEVRQLMTREQAVEFVRDIPGMIAVVPPGSVPPGTREVEILDSPEHSR